MSIRPDPLAPPGRHLPARPHRAAVLLCGLLAASCAAGSGPRPALARYDGTYDGAFDALPGSQACAGTGGSVRFRVSGTHIWSDSRQKHRRLEGTVTAAGELGMVSEDGRRLVAGTIAGGRLDATETMPGSRATGAAPCISRIAAALASAR